MARKKKILIVGDTTDVLRFKPLLEEEGINVESVDKFPKAKALALKEHMDAIVFVLPRYWEDITVFIKELRAVQNMEDTLIFYLGSLIEGEDQVLLHKWGVKTLTLGPVPDPEVVRYIVHLLHIAI